MVDVFRDTSPGETQISVRSDRKSRTDVAKAQPGKAMSLLVFLTEVWAIKDDSEKAVSSKARSQHG